MSFQLENNVPEYYVNKSRDFQLLCRVIDIYLKGCMDRASNMIHQLDISECNESLLYAIANMQGFTTNIYIPPNVLRNILKVFPYCIKNKGNEWAIRTMVEAIISADRIVKAPTIVIDKDSYIIDIIIDSSEQYIQYLEEALRFIVPTGWNIRISILYEVEPENQPDDYYVNESYVARFSILPSKIMNSPPTTLTPDKTKNTLNGTGIYSRLSTFKILSAGNSKNNLINEKFGAYDKDSNSLININNGSLNYISDKIDTTK